MNKEELIARLKRIISPFSQNEVALESFNENTDFIKDLKINSANLVDLILDLEEEFEIEIDNESMSRILTVKTAIEVITEKLKESGRE